MNRGHYSDAVLSHLESQNDEEVEGISAKVKMLKDVRTHIPHLPPTTAIFSNAHVFVRLQ